MVCLQVKLNVIARSITWHVSNNFFELFWLFLFVFVIENHVIMLIMLFSFYSSSIVSCC